MNMSSNKLCRKRSSSIFRKMIGVVFVALSIVSRIECVLQLPEFAEPIKNVTLPIGSDVEFSCDVRHLGTYRVTWSWKNETEQKFLAIGIVKIIRNPRVQISRIQKSDDVTQFNLYVYNLQSQDEGIYFCSVNSNPAIEQIGTLNVTGEEANEAHSVNGKINGKIFNGRGPALLKEDDYKSSKNSPNTSYPQQLPNSSLADTFSTTNSTVVCIDLGEMWESARERLKEFLSAIMKFSYSYWYS